MEWITFYRSQWLKQEAPTSKRMWKLRVVHNDMKDRLDTFNDEKETLKEYEKKYLNQELGF